MSLTRTFKLVDGIHVFDSDMNPDCSAYDSRHLKHQEDEESQHFWFQARREKICDLMNHRIGKNEKILELGAGTGFIAQKLKEIGFSIDISDIHLNGLKFAQDKGIKKLFQFDLFNPPFRDEYSAICLFDVLEHQSNDQLAIECIKKMVKPKGKIILTVPAHQWLWNRDDRINGHYRRYNKKSLLDLCKKCELTPIHVEYFFIFILPLLFLRTLVNRDHKKAVKTEEKLKMSLPGIINQTCSILTKTEFALSKWLPNLVGGSLLLIAQRND